MLKTCCENVRKNVPLVHNITNYVTVNDVANVLLACGGSPIMSDEPEDVADITCHLRRPEPQHRNPASETSIEAMLPRRTAVAKELRSSRSCSTRSERALPPFGPTPQLRS